MTGKRGERLQVMLTREEVSAVEEWRFENRMPSRSAAVRALMNLGLKSQKHIAIRGSDKDLVSSGDIGIVETNGGVRRHEDI